MPPNQKRNRTLNRKPPKIEEIRLVFSKQPPLDEAETSTSPFPEEPRSLLPSTLGGEVFIVEEERQGVGTGPAAAGQAGSLQDVSHVEQADNESVAELLEEGQAHEAEAVSGVEQAGSADEGEVTTHEPGHEGS